MKTRSLLRTALAVITVAACAHAQTLNLFNGISLQGWNVKGTWTSTNNMLASSGDGNHYALTSVPFGDFSLQFEYNQSGPSGAKLRAWANKESSGGLTVDLDLAGAPAGVGGIEGETKSSVASVSGGWHKVEVQASHGSFNVKVDGMSTGSANGLGSRAGFIGFETNGGPALQLRGIKLTPLNPNNTFNNTDLNGWKSVAHSPQSKGGVGHTMEKTLTFGIGGGSTKPHEAKWTVQSSAIHGEDGPGGLENAIPVEDGIIRLVASVKGNVKQDNFTSIGLRNQQGQLAGGYSVGIGPYAGAIDHVVTHPFGQANSAVDETIVIAGRTIAIWINGNIAMVHIDPRPESNDTGKGAKTAGGAAMLMLPNKDVQLDVKAFSMTTLGKSYGGPVHVAAPPPPPPVAVAPPPPTPAAAETGAAAAIIAAQQQQTQKKDQEDQQKQQKVAGLMSQALSTTDPQQQMSLYGQVVQVDPSNAAAVQGFKEAQAKVQAQQAAAQQQQVAQQVAQTTQQSNADATNASLAQAQGSFLRGHLNDASNALSVAERLSPGNPLVRDLRARISASMALRSRLYFLGGGAGLIGLLALGTVWLRRRRQQRYPVLEVTRGLDSGRHYPLDKDTVRIGAVSQDGAQKNDIVVRDVEHAVSRFHCEIVKRNGDLYLTDLKSSNGTRVNGKSLEPGKPHPLRKGNKITLANSIEMEFGYDRRSKQDKQKS